MTQHLFKQARLLRQQGQNSQALALFRDSIRRGQLGPQEMERAGRFIAGLTRPADDDRQVHRVLVLGQCTTSWVVNCLVAHGLGDDVLLQVQDGEYDNVLQELLKTDVADLAPQTVVLVPWLQRLLGGGTRTPEERVSSELEFWVQMWTMIAERYQARVVQVGYDWVQPGPMGYHLSGQPGGPAHMVRDLNARLRDALPQGSYFVDLPMVSGEEGRRHFYDARRYYWTKQPFSEEGADVLARHIWAGVRALVTGPKKVLVLDLDNTVWGGVVGEMGPLGVTLGETPDGEAFRAFQAYARQLKESGTVLCVATKNNAVDAREPFEGNPEMVLALDDISVFSANWEPKVSALAQMSETLNLGIDSFVFFDDNPVEREHVRQARPEVSVVDVPDDPANYVQALSRSLLFERIAMTGADEKRAEQYRVEAKRKETSATFATREEYYTSLEMVGDVGVISEGDMPRVVQLIAKTNQFNLTTRRYSFEQVEHQRTLDGAIPLSLRLHDRFGSYGLIAIMIGLPDGEGGLRLDTWLMSCRAIGRTVEDFFFAQMMERAREAAYGYLIGEYLPTRKNSQVGSLYERLGFTLVEQSADGAATWRLDLAAAEAPAHFVTLKNSP